MGGDLTLGSVEQPLPPAAGGTDMAGATERLAHVAQILPAICTIDCGPLHFGEGDYIMPHTPAMLTALARPVPAPGVRPEHWARATSPLPPPNGPDGQVPTH